MYAGVTDLTTERVLPQKNRSSDNTGHLQSCQEKLAVYYL